MPSLKPRIYRLLAIVFLACISLHLDSTFKVFAGSTGTIVDCDARVRRVEATAADISMGENQPPLRLDLEKLMQTFNVPGISIAVIDNFQIVCAEAYGVVEARSSMPVTTRTLFQAGSISKPVTAAGALYLVEHGQLSLDEDVNRKLKSWKVPENEFTQTEKVTLRRLMSHTGGLTVHGFPGYDVDEPLPTLVEILNGEKPANTPPIRVDFIPGTRMRYSGGGITIEQQLMMDVTAKPFPALMRKIVLDRVGMTDSSYEQPLPASRAAMTASGTDTSGKTVHGRWHIYPEMAAAGLWTTAIDLSKFAIEIALSKKGQSNRILSEQMTQTMLTPVLNGAGLGFFMDKDNPGQFGHGGSDDGFQALLAMNANSGQGVAIMANSDNGTAVGSLLVESVAREYAWNQKSSGPDVYPVLVIIAKLKGVEAALARYGEFKRSQHTAQQIGEYTLNGLGYTLLLEGRAQDAIRVFQRNVQEYPNSFNVYNSLGEAYMKAGQKDLAIANYENSLKLNPRDQSAIDALKKLKETK